MEHEQNSEERAAYGQQTLRALFKELTKEFGRGFSVSNIQLMRRFHHSNSDKRGFYEKEAVNSGWSVREMKRQIATSLYERLLLSDGKANKGASKNSSVAGRRFFRSR